MVDKLGQMQPRSHHATAAAQAAREARSVEDTQVPPTVEPTAPVVVPTAPQFTSFVTPPTDIVGTQQAQQPSRREVELEQQLAVEKQRVEQLNTQYASTQKATEDELTTLRKLNKDRELNDLVNFSDMEFDSIDTAAVQELSQKVFKPLVGRLQQDYNDRLGVTQTELRAEQQKRIDAETRVSDAQRTTQHRTTNDAIFKAHPDFEQVRNSPEFTAFAGQPTRPGAALSVGALMANEYHSGNADFIIQAVNEFKQGRPSLEAIAGAPTTTSANAPVMEAGQPQYTEADVTKWNQERAVGKLSREEYSKLRQVYNTQKTAAHAAK